jgi:hypothetical protein
LFPVSCAAFLIGQISFVNTNPVLTCKYKTLIESLAMNKRSSLFVRVSMTKKKKRFYEVDTSNEKCGIFSRSFSMFWTYKYGKMPSGSWLVRVYENQLLEATT